MFRTSCLSLASATRTCTGALFLLLLAAAPSGAATTCRFEQTGSTLHLTGDCTTDASILIPDGMTLDGGGFTIVALDPAGGAFEGGVVVGRGSYASIVDTRIEAILARPACRTGSRRLRGIFFDGARGMIRGNTITGVNQGTSRCNEGNAVEVTGDGGTSPRPVVEIAGNTIGEYQKTGIVVSGEVDAWIHDNRIGPSAMQELVAANGVQVGFGARATIDGNAIAGNSWSVDVNQAGTGILLYRSAPGSVVRENLIDGNADIGIHVQADGARIEGNRVFETGADGFYDVGIGNYGSGNVILRNRVRGYVTSYEPAGRSGAAAARVARR